MPDLDPDTHYMQRALRMAERALDAGQTPFGACIVRQGAVLAESHNNVLAETDCTAHAEMCALRQGCKNVDNIHLPGSTIYSTVEPCPMCFTAIHWARVDRIVFGGRIADVAAFGFNELPLTNERLKDLAHLRIALTPDCCRDEAVALFNDWQARGGRAY